MKVLKKQPSLDAIRIDGSITSTVEFIKDRRGTYDLKHEGLYVWPIKTGAPPGRTGDYIIYNGDKHCFDILTPGQFNYFYEVEDAQDQ